MNTDIRNKDLATLLFYAIRYSRGKPQAVVNDVTTITSRYLDALSPLEREIMSHDASEQAKTDFENQDVWLELVRVL